MTYFKIDRKPQTGESLRRDLAALGVGAGMTLMVHSSLSKIGCVVGGAPVVVTALIDQLGEDGTLAMPAASPECSDPATWTSPAVAGEWLEEVRDHLPLFDIWTTPTAMGAIPETFRTWPGTLRSDDPLVSVCARGPRAPSIVSEHARSFSEGLRTPFGKLYTLEAWILLLGVGFNRCTALHFAESLVEKRRTTTSRYAVMEKGKRVWVEVPNMADDNSVHFPAVGEQYVATGKAVVGQVGEAQATLLPMRDLVEFATAYFEREL